MVLKVLTFNVHKFRHPLRRTYLLEKLKKNLKSHELHVVCLQELIGIHPKKYSNDYNNDPLEHLADEIWQHYAYGKNAVYPKGHHGNAILSYFPINDFYNFNISNHSYEQRGILRAEILIDNIHPLNVFTLHLDLTEWGRAKQIKRLIQLVNPYIEKKQPLLVMGDFNDWRLKSHTKLLHANLQEAAAMTQQKLFATFPSVKPVFPLDRIYFSGLNCIKAEVLKTAKWRKMSDHLPIYAEFEYDPPVT
ncbi:MAG: endonuclease/exonuclease/phosphatase family protein [Bdellovibrionales bacterium]|nr:endonuclease/exonuclease/phosphatase family protein [Bdellovibrionales bacterium]